MREFLSYVDPLGAEYKFNIPAQFGRWALSESGWGTPPIEYITQRGSSQHGESVVGIWLRPRTIQLLVRANYCSRDTFWSGRSNLLNAIRPNRQSSVGGVAPGQLIKTLPDGSRRALDVYIAEGPRFEPDQIGKWDQWSYQEVLRFIAYNPVVYDPTEHTDTFVQAVDQLVFPITFGTFSDLTFASFGTTFIPSPGQVLFYVGTWLEYPTIVITGPFQTPTMVNVTTGERLALLYTLAAGETVTIDLAYGAKTVESSVNGNVIGTLSSDSDLATWHLAPDPEAGGGVNVIKVDGYGTNGSSSVVIRWKARYFGI